MKPLDLLRDDLQEILATKEYQIYTQQETKSFLEGLLDSLMNWLQQMLQSIFPQVDIGKTTSEWLSYGVISLGMLLLLLLLFLLVSRFVRQGRIYSRQVTTSMEQSFTEQRHLAEAHRLSEEENYSLALRHLFLGFILYLDQSQRIEAKAWKTNWEYYAELNHRAPQLANSFYTLAVKFEEAIYGGRPIAKDEYWSYYKQIIAWIHKGDTK